MSKIVLEFNLPEEREDFDTTVNAWKYLNALDNFDNYLRSKLKYETLTEQEYTIYLAVREKLWEFRNDE